MVRQGDIMMLEREERSCDVGGRQMRVGVMCVQLAVKGSLPETHIKMYVRTSKIQPLSFDHPENDNIPKTSIYLPASSASGPIFSFDYNLKYMNQRSTSMIRKMKTDLDQNTFDRRIAKAMKDKKDVISRMTTPRAVQQMRNYSTHNPYGNRQEKSIDEGHAAKQKQNTILIDRKFMESVQEQAGFGVFPCVNHPKKRGIFEGANQRQHYYCHECAIHLVKSNIQVKQISSQSLIVKMFLQEQFEKIAQEETKAKSAIEDYYLGLKETFLNLYKTCHESIYRCETIEFGIFKNSDSLHRIIDSLGEIQPCHLKFQLEGQKQNMTGNFASKQSLEKPYYKKDRSIDPRAQSNRSLEANVQKNTSFVARSRDNSFYKKNSKVDIPKIGKQQAKKGLNLR